MPHVFRRWIDRPDVQVWSRRLISSATGGAGVVIGTVIASNLLRIVSSMTLTRLLNAEAFGIVGIISSVAYVLTMISDAGMYAYVVRHERGAEPQFLDQMWTIRLARSLLLTIGMVALAWPIARYTEKPMLQMPIAVFGLTFLIEGMSSMSFATAVREQQLRRLSVNELVAAVAQLVITIACALITNSYWALIGGILLGAATKSVLSYVIFPHTLRRLRWSSDEANKLWRFSRYVAMSSIITLPIMQLDKLVFARIMSLEVFGLYAIATTLATAPLAIVSAYVHKLLYPAFAAAYREDSQGLRDLYYRRGAMVTAGYTLLVGLMIGVAPVLVAALYDPRYLAVAGFMRWLAIASMFAMSTQASEQVMIATGNVAMTLAGNVVRMVWLALAAAIAIVLRQPYALVIGVGTVEIPTYLFFAVKRSQVGLIEWRRELPAFLSAGIGVALGLALTDAVQIVTGLSF